MAMLMGMAVLVLTGMWGMVTFMVCFLRLAAFPPNRGMEVARCLVWMVMGLV